MTDTTPSRWAGVMAAILVLAAPLQPARADTATLLLSDMCGDPSNIFDWEWSRVANESTTLFYLADDGTVSAISDGANALDTFDTLYTAAHGGGGEISDIPNADFAQFLHDAHASTPSEMFFAVCAAAVGPDSLLKATNDAYDDDIPKLTGGVAGCALVGDGDMDLANAVYLINVTHSDDERFDRIQTNIEDKWAGNYPESEQSYREVCQARLEPFNRANVLDFVDTVLVEFSQPAPPGHPDQSTNYLDLVALNNGGDALFVCGANPAGAGAVPCP
ncbi:MAG: hypothetical protein QNJ16_00900 [Rhodobacter sp.]|nr:hypothetical protein [Rhodobacter sp.]